MKLQDFVNIVLELANEWFVCYQRTDSQFTLTLLDDQFSFNKIMFNIVSKRLLTEGFEQDVHDQYTFRIKSKD